MKTRLEDSVRTRKEGILAVEKHIRVVLCIVSAIVCHCAAWQEAQANQQVDTGDLKYILTTGYKDGTSVLSDCRVTIEAEAWRDPNWLKIVHGDKRTALTTISTEYARKGAKERYSYRLVSDYYPEGTRSFKIFDGIYLLDWMSTKGSGDSETQRGRGALSQPSKFSGLMQGAVAGPGYVLCSDHGVTFEDVVSASDVVIDNSLENINGFRSYEVKATLIVNRVPYEFIYWVCPDRSFLPIKMEIREEDGTLFTRAQVSKFLELGDGRWFPEKVVHEGFSSRKPGYQWLMAKDTYVVKKMELSPSLDEDVVFDTSPDSLPVGTLLDDACSGLRYVIGEGPVSDERIKKLIDKTLDGEIDIGPDLKQLLDSNATTPDPESGIPAAKPLFSEKGVFGSDTGDDMDESTGGDIPVLAVAGGGLLVLAGLLLIVISRQRKKRGINEKASS